MWIQISPKTSFRVLRFVGSGLGFWPVKKTDGLYFLALDYWFWFSLSNYVIIMVPLSNGLYINRKNVIAASYSWMEVIGYIEAMVILVFNKCQRSRLKALISRTEDQLDIPKVPTVRQYASFYAEVYLGILFCYVLAVLMYQIIDRPKHDNQTILMSAIYPFNTDSKVVKVFVYFNQIYTLIYSSIIPNFDGISVFLIFTLTDRLKLLEQLFEKATSYTELVYCIKEHHDILRLIKETNYFVRFIVLKTVLSFMSIAIGSGLQILNNAAFLPFLHQVGIMSLVYARLYLCAESAENMTTAGADIERAIYFTPWYTERPKIVTAKSIVIESCKKLPTISVNGFMTKLNRKYLGVILYATVSYLMTLSTVVGSKY